MVSAANLVDTLESSGWALDVRSSGSGVSGLATHTGDGVEPPVRLTAWGRDRASVVLLLFEQACARMLPDYPHAS